ncbi:hypothetical protein Pcinc_020553 [Petrolisthes cinctipes]|uniref:Uncharacterized protein n=1 Tax=Petrolisthes cinctipes TaxID=88211 RepID=A0AAE1FJ94_PETCI|nr:hypothetical protein Pcinc_020553 [Petrolisthes cinctipes]
MTFRLKNVAAWRAGNTGGDREEEHQTQKIGNEWRENCCREIREKAGTVFPELIHTYTNLVGRELVVATVNNFPFFNLLYRDGLPPLPHTGIDFNIVQALATTLNFTESPITLRQEELLSNSSCVPHLFTSLLLHPGGAYLYSTSLRRSPKSHILQYLNTSSTILKGCFDFQRQTLV